MEQEKPTPSHRFHLWWCHVRGAWGFPYHHTGLLQFCIGTHYLPFTLVQEEKGKVTDWKFDEYDNENLSKK